MRKLYPLCALIFSLLAPQAFGGLTWAATQQDLEVPADQKTVLVDFAFKNEGPDVVEISSLQTSCGCTAATVESKKIAPGESGSVHVKFAVGSRKGEQVKSVIVRTSDKAKQSLILKMRILPKSGSGA